MSTSTAVTEAVDAWLRRRLRLRDMQINETYAAVALTAATITALVWANVGHSYHSFWQTPASLAIGPFKVELSLHGWVDEGLMTAFFFMVGLDVRRDLTLGELRLPGRALLPVVSAIGGLVVPALVYLGIPHGTDGAHAIESHTENNDISNLIISVCIKNIGAKNRASRPPAKFCLAPGQLPRPR